MVQSYVDKSKVLRLDSSKRIARPDMRRTGLTWSGFQEDTKETIWQTLRFEFALPRGFQWVLHDAIDLDPQPSLLTRVFVRLVPGVEYKEVKSESYIVVFVPTNSKKSREDAFGQIDVADHDMSGGPPVAADAIPGPYSLQDRRRRYQPETGVPLGGRHYTPIHTGEHAAMYPRHYTDSSAFVRPGYPPPADRMPLDRMPSDRNPVYRMPAYGMPMDRMPDRMPDQMPVDRMPSYGFPTSLHAMPPPAHADRPYQQRTPRPRNGDSPGRNGYPPLSEDKHASAPRSRTSAATERPHAAPTVRP